MTAVIQPVTPLHLAPSESTIGRLLLDQGKITPEEAERILRMQKERGMRFGEAAVELGLVKPADIDQVLARQFHYPYLQPGEGGFAPDLVAAYDPFSAKVEQLRALRSQLMLRWFGTGRKGLVVCGVDADASVSLLAANLAIVFSQLGENTLLVDANLRTPQQQGLFNLGQRAGLSEILAGRGTLAAINRIPSFLSLSVLTAGTQPPNPMELLGRAEFKSLCQAGENDYDVMLFEAPPLTKAADALTLAARAGGVLLVGQRNVTQVANVRAVGEQIARAGAEIVGSVLVGV